MKRGQERDTAKLATGFGLKAEAGNVPLRDWISRQSQEDLDRLGLGLVGGVPNGYLVLDLHSRGGLGWPAGRCGAE